MASMTISVNDNVKRDFTRFCDAVGLSASAVINVCMVTISRERRIPFTIAAPELSSSQEEARQLCEDIEISRREFAEGKGIPSDIVFNRLRKKLMASKKAKSAV